MTRALVLSGGGAKCSYQVGALDYLFNEKGYEYDMYVGTSGGALNCAYLAMYPDGCAGIKDLQGLWKSLNNDKIFKKWYAGFFGVFPFWKPSMMNSAPLAEVIRNNISPERLKTSGKLLNVGAVSWTTSEYRSWDQNSPDICEAVYASSSYQIAFPPVKIDGQYWGDAGLKRNIPLENAIEMGATDIDVIVTYPPGLSHYEAGTASFIELAFRAVSILHGEVDEWILSTHLKYNPTNVNIRVLRPKVPLNGSSLNFDPDAIIADMKTGYNDAKLYFR